MHHAMLMRIGERLRRVSRYGHDLRQRERTFARQSLAQGFALHQGHHVPEKVFCLPGIEKGNDERVLEPGGNLDLAQEPVGGQRDNQFRAEHLDGHGALVLHIGGGEHHRHAPAADLASDLVPACDRRSKAVGEFHKAAPQS